MRRLHGSVSTLKLWLMVPPATMYNTPEQTQSKTVSKFRIHLKACVLEVIVSMESALPLQSVEPQQPPQLVIFE